MTVLTLLAVLSCARHKLPTAVVRVGDVPVKVELATTPDTRSLGLKHRDSMPQDEGMLFMYPQTHLRSFWMQDTRIPLSIAFADEDGKIVRIADMSPFSTDRVPSLYPVRYALEMNKGWFAKNGVEKGDVLGEIPNVNVE
ncbi:MAG: DUF192 domain-containing protein [Proteobacteria bacterium]|jgi:uncharacterized protein|nr:DUF192 domain-containing protein [Pseudomonadota bacterium]